MLKLVVLLSLTFSTFFCRHLTEEEKNAVLDEHNRIRRMVALGDARGANMAENFPTATDMRKMVWDDDLANNAKVWAEQQTCDHDPDIGYENNQGENLAMSSAEASAELLKEMVSDGTQYSWWGELSAQPGKLGPQNTVCQLNNLTVDDETIGHATQVIWAKSGRLGCAVDSCSEYNTYLVCRYSDLGNFMFNGERRMYTAGDICAACPDDCDDGLCTNDAVGGSECDAGTTTSGSGGTTTTTTTEATTTTSESSGSTTTCGSSVPGNPFNDWGPCPNCCLCTIVTQLPGGGTQTQYTAEWGPCGQGGSKRRKRRHTVIN